MSGSFVAAALLLSVVVLSNMQLRTYKRDQSAALAGA